MTGQYNNCALVPACSGNYREGRIATVDRLIVHVTESDNAEGAVAWFQNPSAQVSAHYVIGADGTITQSVFEENTAWAAPTFNARGLHVEHAGWTNKTAFPDAQLEASAALYKHLGTKYSIPLDRTHILGHSELPNNDHKDPGNTWPWAKFMALVTGAVPETAHFWNHPDGITVASNATFSMRWPSATAHATIVANGKYPVWEGGPGATASLNFTTPGPHSLVAMATDAAGKGLGSSTLLVTVV